jgi:hypothetical protein
MDQALLAENFSHRIPETSPVEIDSKLVDGCPDRSCSAGVEASVGGTDHKRGAAGQEWTMVVTY